MYLKRDISKFKEMTVLERKIDEMKRIKHFITLVKEKGTITYRSMNKEK